VQSSLRRHNLSVVLHQIALGTTRREPVSRADIAATTGITKATVSALVDRLITGQLVEELPPASPAGAGRPAKPIMLARGRVAALGLEVNADFVGARVVDLTGAVLAESIFQFDLRHSDPGLGLSRLAQRASDVLEQLPAQVSLAGAGLALPGLIDPVSGRLIFAPNLGWSQVDARESLLAAAESAQLTQNDQLVKALAYPRIHNEAVLAAKAHATTETDPAASFLYISGDIGIGAAVFMEGRPFGGLHGWAGEIGHNCIEPDGQRCSCGATGCLETVAGKAALLRACGLEEPGGMDRLEDLLAADDARSPAHQAVDRAGHALGQAVADAINLVDLNRVVLGGTMARLADHLVPIIYETVNLRAMPARWGDPITVAASPYRSYPAMSGAAMAVLDGVIADPAALLDA